MNPLNTSFLRDGWTTSGRLKHYKMSSTVFYYMHNNVSMFLGSTTTVTGPLCCRQAGRYCVISIILICCVFCAQKFCLHLYLIYSDIRLFVIKMDERDKQCPNIKDSIIPFLIFYLNSYMVIKPFKYKIGSNT